MNNMTVMLLYHNTELNHGYKLYICIYTLPLIYIHKRPPHTTHHTHHYIHHYIHITTYTSLYTSLYRHHYIDITTYTSLHITMYITISHHNTPPQAQTVWVMWWTHTHLQALDPSPPQGLHGRSQ